MSRRSLLRRGGALAAHRGRRRGAGRLREHHDAGGRRRRRAAAARASWATRPRAGRSTAPASRSRAATTRSTLPRLGDAGQELGASPSAAASCRSTTTPTTSTRRSSRSSASRRASASASRRSTRSTRRSRSSAPAASQFDVIFSTPDQLSRLVGRRAHPAAELRADPEPAEERLAGAAQPVLRRRPALHASRTRSTRPGSAGATTMLELRPEQARQPWDAFWTGREVPRARSAILDDSREGLGHGADAPRRDRPQHRGPGPARSRPATDLKELNEQRRA